MPDNVTLPGTGSVVEAVEVGGALRQVVQVANLPGTQPVSATALPLPTGAATEVTAAALLAAAQAIKTAAETLAGRTINTGAVSGTVALDGPTLVALEAISADTGLAQPLTDAQLRASAVPVSGAVTATVTGGTVVGVAPTTTNAILSSAATTNGTVAKASAGTIYGLTVSNTGPTAAFVKLHNSTTITVGTTAVALTVPVPAGGVVSLALGTQGMLYETGICYSITNRAADTDTTAVARNDVKVNLSYI